VHILGTKKKLISYSLSEYVIVVSSQDKWHDPYRLFGEALFQGE
jgi:hypothetical protein